MNKTELEKQLLDLRAQNTALEKKCSELEAQTDDAVRNTSAYRTMQHSAEFYQSMEKYEQDMAKEKMHSAEKMIAEAKKVIEDNKELCKEHGIEYWPGMTKTRFDNQIEELEKEIISLKAEIQLKDKIIEYQRSWISTHSDKNEQMDKSMSYEEKFAELIKKKTGRPKKISPKDEREIKQLRKKGYSLRNIAAVMNVSLGTVQNVIKKASN